MNRSREERKKKLQKEEEQSTIGISIAGKNHFIIMIMIIDFMWASVLLENSIWEPPFIEMSAIAAAFFRNVNQ